MHDPFFAVPIMVETEKVGQFRTLSSVSEVAIFMMEPGRNRTGQGIGLHFRLARAL